MKDTAEYLLYRTITWFIICKEGWVYEIDWSEASLSFHKEKVASLNWLVLGISSTADGLLCNVF